MFQVKPPSIEPLLLDERAAAKALAISPRTLSKLRKRGELSCVRVGRAVRYDIAELRRLVVAKSSSA